MTYKYYEIDNNFTFPQMEEDSTFEVIPFSNTVIGVNAEDHSVLDFLDGLTELTFADIEEVLEESHMNKELNRELVKLIRKKYTMDDEIAIRLKDSADPKRISFEDYISIIKNDVYSKKIKYGLKL